MTIIELEEVDSTNEYCKRNDSGEDMIVTAVRQISGKGTKGRSFVSQSGGLYISVMRHYTDLPSDRVFGIMVNSCVAVCRAAESAGVRPVIRWANDVLADGLKISGTLIENSFSGDKIVRSIVGIGINLNNELPEGLKGIATSVKALTGSDVDIPKFKDKLVSCLSQSYTIADYKGYMPWLGEEVTLNMTQGVRTVRAIDIAQDGRLVVSDGDIIEKISAAEVSLRLR